MVGIMGADGGAPGIAFPRGLPGFPDANRFALRPLGDAASGLLVMQSEEDPALRFLVLPYREREVELRRVDLDEACDLLGVPREHAAFLLVVTRQPGAAGSTGARTYVNLRAPVVIDTERRTAVQHVLASPGYSVRHPLAAAA
jgi:flagellar assembly factor FliW